MYKIYILIVTALSFCSILAGQGYTDYLGAGHDSGIIVTSSSEDGRSRADNTVNARGMDAEQMEMARFLSQATFGSDIEEVERALTLGMETWIDEQVYMPFNYLTPQMWEIWDDLEMQHQMSFDVWLANYINELCYAAEQDPNVDPPNMSQEEVDLLSAYYLNDFYGPYALHFNFAWTHNMIESPDQLRQRVAYALSQILVISGQSDLGEYAETLTTYYDILTHHAFGNFKDLLLEVTLNPAMGLYLSHLNNPKAIPSENIHPDENYAREVMQLFSIGLYELNIDGTRKKDIDGNDIPTYNNDDIKEMAKIFTGLAPGSADPRMPHVTWDAHFGMSFYAANKTEPLIMYEEWHDTGSKSLLNGLVIPAGQDGMSDIEMAIDYLYNHDNVGPFIGRQLIQRLIKSNPSPGYIARVATVFNNNGAGERGDMEAVVRAILLDPEARSCEELLRWDNGKLKEPVLRNYEFIRTVPKYGERISYDIDFNSYTCDGYTYTSDTFALVTNLRYWDNGFNFFDGTRQFPLLSPSVFNFYPPDHQPVGEIGENDLVAPEFKIHDSSTAINYINSVYIHTAPYYDLAWYNWYEYTEVEDIKFNFDDLTELYQEDTEKFLHHIDIIFTKGQMSDDLRANLREMMDSFPEWYVENETEALVKSVLYILMWSPDYTIAK